MKKSKVIPVVLCAVLLVVASVAGTLAYLTSQDTVVNTFTIGNVNITLDEAAVTPDGALIDGAARVKANNYHLIPGMTYVKDPTVTVVKGSEQAYVRMTVTINCYDALTDLFSDPFLPQHFVSGWDNATWVSTEVIDVDAQADTATYEFRYKSPVTPGAEEDLVLEPLFESITVPGSMTSEDMAKIADLKITVVGHAIQTVGFADADAAWAAFDAEVNG